MLASPLKPRIRCRELLCGASVSLACAAVVEMAGHARHDYVMIDREHGALGLDTLEHLLRAADASGIPALVRVPTDSAADILHALDAGAHGIVVPHVTSAEQARSIVARAHYPPAGRRGVYPLSRAARYGIVDKASYYAQAAARTIVVLIVEDASALDEVAQIAATPGVDALFVGHGDLAASLGHVGRSRHPEVLAAVARICSQVRAVADGPALMAHVGSAADVPAALEEGFSMLTFSATQILATGLAGARATLPG